MKEQDEGLRMSRQTLGQKKSSVKADIVRLLIKHGADVSVRDKTDATPLHLAAFSGSSEIVRLLLEQGADVTVVDMNHKTPLHLASSRVSDTVEPDNAGLT